MYFKTKIQEEKQNFLLWIERTEKTVTETIDKIKEQILDNFSVVFQKSVQYLKAENEYEELRSFFRNGSWNENEHVEKSVNFLYSEEMLFKFNRNMDNLKRVIHFNKKENNYAFTWINTIRDKFSDFDLCPEHTFKAFIEQYSDKPKLPPCEFSQTKQSRDDE